MFRPAEDMEDRLMAYAMQRNAVQTNANLIRAQEEYETMMAMQQMDPAQMQAMGNAGPYTMADPQQLMQPQQQMMMMGMPPNTAASPQSAPPHSQQPTLCNASAAGAEGAQGQPARTSNDAANASLANGTPSLTDITRGGSNVSRTSSMNAPPRDNSTLASVNSMYGNGSASPLYGGGSMYGSAAALPTTTTHAAAGPESWDKAAASKPNETLQRGSSNLSTYSTHSQNSTGSRPNLAEERRDRRAVQAAAKGAPEPAWLARHNSASSQQLRAAS